MGITRLPVGGLWIVLASIGSTALLAAAWSGQGRYAALSLATGYTAALLLAATLLVTPLHRLRRHRPAPAHLVVRRRLGIATAVVAGVHVGVSFPVHLGGDVRRYFFADDGWFRTDAFGVSNWVGLAGIVMLVVLLATSTDGWVRRLGIQRWKRLHSVVFAAAAATVIHTVGYQSLRHARGLLTALVMVAVAGSVAVRLVSRRSTSRP